MTVSSMYTYRRICTMTWLFIISSDLPNSCRKATPNSSNEMVLILLFLRWPSSTSKICLGSSLSRALMIRSAKLRYVLRGISKVKQLAKFMAFLIVLKVFTSYLATRQSELRPRYQNLISRLWMAWISKISVRDKPLKLTLDCMRCLIVYNNFINNSNSNSKLSVHITIQISIFIFIFAIPLK